MSEEFKVGDKVRIVDDNEDDPKILELVGTIIKGTGQPYPEHVGIEYEVPIKNGKDCEDRGKYGHCQWTYSNRVRLVRNVKLLKATHAVIWEVKGCGDPSQLFSNEKDAKVKIKDLSERTDIVEGSILFLELKSVKKVSVTKSLRFSQHKVY